MSALDVLRIILIAIAASGTLWTFYRSFESEWPDRYFDGTLGADPLVSRTPWRYAAFRLGPLFLTLVVVGTVASRLDLSRAAAVWSATALYAATGPLRKSVEAFRSRPIQMGSFVHRVATALGMFATAGAYLLVGDRLDGLVPAAKDVVIAAWVGIFVFLMSRVGLLLSTIKPPEPSELAARALNEMDDALVQELKDADPAGVFLTIAIVEQLNRPAWVRLLERKLLRNASYGLMQLRSNGSISDAESVRRFVERHHKHTGKDSWDWEELERFFRRHNPSPEFEKLAQEIYWTVQERGL